jgi:hypothetical protein
VTQPESRHEEFRRAGYRIECSARQGICIHRGPSAVAEVDQRLAYIFGETVEMEHREATVALGRVDSAHLLPEVINETPRAT